MNLRTVIRGTFGATAFVALSTTPVYVVAQELETIEEIIVTSQKREENIQTVPIAVSALTAEMLETHHINLAQDLPRAVPNLYFSRAGLGFNETNFQLRGVGYQLVSTSGDAGVGVHVNNAPIAVSRMANSEIYDMERVEVLRGPQGTLYGRNATGGVINMITAKPEVGSFFGEGNVEYGTYDHKRLSAFVNVPMGDYFAMRIAGFGLQRDGYSENKYPGAKFDVDGRELWSGRTTLAINPDGGVRATLMWEHWNEDDTRVGNSKNLCIKDPGPTSVGGVTINSTVARGFLNRGCLQGSIYSPEAFGTVNYNATLAGQLGTLAGLLSNDVYAGVTQSTDLRELSVVTEPSYIAKSDLAELNLEFDLTDSLKFVSLSSYLKDDVDTRSSAVGYLATTHFNPGPVTPGGVYNDPILGATSEPGVMYINDLSAKQYSQELRLQSSFDGAVNFSIGALYLNLERLNDIFISPNTQNAYAQLVGAGTAGYFDGSATPDGTGHNYYVSRNPYELTAAAAFGELYIRPTDWFQLTTGVRYTDDKKEIDLHPITMLTPGTGWPATGANARVEQEARFKEVTGRVNASFNIAEDHLIYTSYSKGYKGGGINAPDIAAGEFSPTYDPEFVNAYELGSKNEFFGGHVQANVTAFMYDYENYQITALRGLTATTENVDAEIKGLEFEGVWKPTESLRFNANVGWLNTELKNGSSVDTFDRTQGNPNLTLVKSTSAACVVPTAAMATFVTLLNNGTAFIPTASGTPRAATARDILGICAGSFAGLGLTPSNGVEVNLEGKELPQSPELTSSVGAEYTLEFANGWSASLAADYFYQTDSFTRVYNSESDRLKGWDNANASLTFANMDFGLEVQLYGKNLMDDDVITGFDTSSDAQGLSRNISLLDPRLFGISIRKSF